MTTNTCSIFLILFFFSKKKVLTTGTTPKVFYPALSTTSSFIKTSSQPRECTVGKTNKPQRKHTKKTKCYKKDKNGIFLKKAHLSISQKNMYVTHV